VTAIAIVGQGTNVFRAWNPKLVTTSVLSEFLLYTDIIYINETDITNTSLSGGLKWFRSIITPGRRPRRAGVSVPTSAALADMLLIHTTAQKQIN
jgi:hypothetical protein